MGSRTWRRVLIAVGATAMVSGALHYDAVAAVPSDATEDAIVQAGLFTASDFPAGWTEDPPASGSLAPGAVAGSASSKCAALAEKSPQPDVRESSARFSNGTVIEVSDIVGVFSNDTAVTTAFKLSSSRALLSCYRAGLRKTVRQQPTSGLQRVLSVEKVASPVSERSVAYEAKFRFVKSGASGAIFAVYVLVPVGRTGITFEFTSIGTPVSSARQRSLIAPVIQRVDEAQRP
ncbi:MAG TPA: hypothetical protein VEP49_19460 [Acidimicrobiia bacterium]|nr:hypothetical protein [Acidimicrobiia bacterium]